jgi:hypothetical protein
VGSGHWRLAALDSGAWRRRRTGTFRVGGALESAVQNFDSILSGGGGALEF